MNVTSAASGVVSDEPDVLIVGCGPVGLMTANLLGLYGVRTLIVDARDSLIDYPRGVGIDDEGLRTFQSAGLVDQVLPHTVPNQLMVFLNGKGKVLARMSPSAEDYGWPRRNGFIQPLADQVLLDGLSRFAHVEVRWGHELTGIEQDEKSVLAHVVAGGRTTTIQAAYLVGADGGSSRTRGLLDLRFDGTSSSTSWLVVDVSNDPLGRPGCYVGADPRRPYVSISLPHGLRRFEFLIDAHEAEDAARDRRFSEHLMGQLLERPAETDIIRWRVYTHHSRLSEHFKIGRVMLAGDAAHLMPVWQGQGYNSGLRDALNLAWKLSLVVRGVCGVDLLDTYEAERRDHVAAMVKLSTLVGRFVSTRSAGIAALRDVAFRGLGLAPPLKNYLTHMRFKPMPKFDRGVVTSVGSLSAGSPVGRLFIQPKVDTATMTNVAFDDAIAPGLALVVWNNDPRRLLDEQSRTQLRAIGARLVEIRPAQQLTWSREVTGQSDLDAAIEADEVTVLGDRDGRLQAWFEAREESVLFIRPDHVIAGASRGEDAGRMAQAVMTAMFVLAPAPRAGSASHRDDPVQVGQGASRNGNPDSADSRLPA